MTVLMVLNRFLECINLVFSNLVIPLAVVIDFIIYKRREKLVRNRKTGN